MIIRNIDDAEPSVKNGSYGGMSGFKDGLIIDGENWLVKYPKNASYLSKHEEMEYTNDPVSEYLGSQIYKILGYPVHETMLVERKGKIAVACKDFVDDTKGQRLLEIRTIKNTANEQLAEILEREFNSTGSTHIVDLEELLLHLDHNDILMAVDGIKERFFDMIVIDAFINNSDRNNGNWGIIREPGQKDRLAPVFDNGGSFNGKTPDSRLQKIMSIENGIINGIMGSMTAFGKGEKAYSVKKLFDLDLDGVNEAILRVVPAIESNMDKITALIQDVPERACSNIRKEYYIKSLEARMEYLLKPLYERLEDKEKGIDEV